MLAKYHFTIKTTKILLISLSLLSLFFILFSNKNSNIDYIPEIKTKSNSLLSSEIKVEYPVFSSNGENSYRILAENIRKEYGEIYHLDKVSGIYNLSNKENITVNALECAMNNKDDSIILNNEVKIGYENYLLLTNEININLQKKSAENNAFVMIIGDNSKITADRFKTNEDFGEIVFKGNVIANFNFANSK